MWKRLLSLLFAGLLVLVGATAVFAEMTPKEKLGEFLFFDTNLSQPKGQSCANCHHPDFAFVDPDSQLPVSEGVLPHRFGNRNSPSAAYAMYAPILFFEEGEGLWIGGQFWDGRATGEVLGDPLADQALGPFVNPVEMHNPNIGKVIKDIKKSSYANLFEEVWGPGSLDNVDTAYNQVALSIAAFERTDLFAPFSSKYDAYLQACLAWGGDPDDCAKGIGDVAEETGADVFSQTEWEGMQLFMGDKAMCSACHVADWTVAADYDNQVVVPAWAPAGMVPPVFTDFTFDNIGAPQNTEDPLSAETPDLGLGVTVDIPEEYGKFKVMSLRNIGLTAPYAHHGFFKSLKDITHFYNTRDVPGAGWSAPEYPDTVNVDELGNLGLTGPEEDAIVAFMMTLSDGYSP